MIEELYFLPLSYEIALILIVLFIICMFGLILSLSLKKTVDSCGTFVFDDYYKYPPTTRKHTQAYNYGNVKIELNPSTNIVFDNEEKTKQVNELKNKYKHKTVEVNMFNFNKINKDNNGSSSKNKSTNDYRDCGEEW